MKSVYALQSMVKHINLDKIFPPITTFVCKTCTMGNQYSAKWGNNEESLATKPLEIVYLDVCGPMRTTSLARAKYFVIFVDDYSRNVWVYTMRCKGKWFQRFKEFLRISRKECGAQNQGVSVYEWRGLHFKRIQSIFLWSMALRARLNTLDQGGVQFKALLQ